MRDQNPASDVSPPDLDVSPPDLDASPPELLDEYLRLDPRVRACRPAGHRDPDPLPGRPDAARPRRAR